MATAQLLSATPMPGVVASPAFTDQQPLGTAPVPSEDVALQVAGQLNSTNLRTIAWGAYNAGAYLWAQSPSGQPTSPSAAELVGELGSFRAGLPGTGLPDANEIRRRAVYDRLWTLGPAALPALIQGLADPDVQIRRNVALFLGAAGGGWYQSGRTPLDIRDCLPALIVALTDADPRVRQLAADAVGAIGADAAAAVPQLIALLASPDEGSRNSACIALTGIGRTARAALPALHQALADSSSDVRRFAQRAIDAIDR